MRGIGGGGPIGNKKGTKLKDPDVRQEAYKQYCDHLAKGKSKKSWCFEHPELTCTWETFDKYLEDEVEFDPLKMKVALIKGFNKWEQVAEDGAIGDNKDVNTACLQMVMRNKFGWDKQQSTNVTVVNNDTVESRIKNQDGSTKELVNESRSDS